MGILLKEGEIDFITYASRIRALKDNYEYEGFDISDSTFPYLAGLIDSDGSIGLGTGGASRKLNLVIRFHQKNKSVCDSLAKRFGGSSNMNSASRSTLNAWSISGKGARDFLQCISPYL